MDRNRSSREPKKEHTVVRCLNLEPAVLWGLNSELLNQPGALVDDESATIFLPVKLFVKAHTGPNGQRDFMIFINFQQGLELVNSTFKFAMAACSPDSAGIFPKP